MGWISNALKYHSSMTFLSKITSVLEMLATKSKNQKGNISNVGGVGFKIYWIYLNII
jgi:hypothetical protein